VHGPVPVLNHQVGITYHWNRLIDFRRIWQFGQCLLSHLVPTIRNASLKILLLLPLNRLKTTDRVHRDRLLSSRWKHTTNNYQHPGGTLALEDWGYGPPGTQSLCWPFQTELTKECRPSNIRTVSFPKQLFVGQLLLYKIYIKCSRWQMLITWYRSKLQNTQRPVIYRLGWTFLNNEPHQNQYYFLF